MVEEIGEKLNLSKHWAGFNVRRQIYGPTGTTTTTVDCLLIDLEIFVCMLLFWLCVDIEGHRGTDGRYYMVRIESNRVFVVIFIEKKHKTQI